MARRAVPSTQFSIAALLLYGRRNNTVAAPFLSLYIIIFRGARVGRPFRGAYNTFTDPLAINIATLEATRIYISHM